MSKTLLACGTIKNEYHEELDVWYRDITVHVGNEEVNDTFASRAAAPYLEGFNTTALASMHLSNAFEQTQAQIDARLEERK